MADDTDHASDSRVGFRDIYRAVGESEARIVAALNAAVAPLGAASADHELRLRQVERHVAESADKDRRLEDVEDLATATAKIVSARGNRGEGMAQTFSGFQKVIISIAAMAAFVSALVGLAGTIGRP